MKTLALILCYVVAALAQTGWVTVRDTREQAFSIDVPKGWTVHGGMFRLGPMDPRPVVDMKSPDGKTEITIGDPLLPAYALASPALARLGLTEGKIMMNLGTWPVIARYRPADEYLTKYGQAHFGQLCQGVQAKEIHSTPPKFVQKSYPGGQISGGEAYFACTVNGQPMLGYLYGETWATAPGPGGLWGVNAIGGFLTPVAQGKATGELLAQSWKSMTFNPAWGKAQADLVNAVAAKSTVNLREHLAQSQAQFEKSMNAIHQQGDAMSDVLTGTTLTRDTSTGQFREVASSTGGRQWINAQNMVMESALSPGPGFHALENVSR